MAGYTEIHRKSSPQRATSLAVVLLHKLEVVSSKGSQTYTLTDQGHQLLTKLRAIKGENEKEFIKRGADITVCSFGASAKPEAPKVESLGKLSVTVVFADVAPSELNPQSKFFLSHINSVPHLYKGLLFLPDQETSVNKRAANDEEIDLDLDDFEEIAPKKQSYKKAHMHEDLEEYEWVKKQIQPATQSKDDHIW